MQFFLFCNYLSIHWGKRVLSPYNSHFQTSIIHAEATFRLSAQLHAGRARFSLWWIAWWWI